MQLGSSCQCALTTLITPGQVELYNSKIYDEELVDQQLGDRIKALQEQLGKVRSSDGSGAVESAEPSSNKPTNLMRSL